MNKIYNNNIEIKNQSLEKNKADIIEKKLIFDTIKAFPGAIEYFEDIYKTEEMCKIAVKYDQKLFKYVPKHLQTSDIWMILIKKNIKFFKYVPFKFKTEEMCKIAVSTKIDMLNFVPKNLMSSDIWTIVIKKNFKIFKYVPYKFKTVEMCIFAVRKNGNMLEFVPDKFKTRKMCCVAVDNNCNMFKYVPDKFKTKIVESLPQKTSEMYLYIVSTLENETMIINKIKKDVNIFRYIVEKTQEICDIAFKIDCSVFASIPDHFKTYKMSLFYVKFDIFGLNVVPDKFRTEELLAILKEYTNKYFS